tara:strand:- start:301 stop:1266 length:966 start_codon:yes stop_codon:yes gene_type:complete
MKSKRKVEFINMSPKKVDMKQLVIEGMNKKPKQFPAWFLYDETGAKLFEKICKQPEYRLTEIEIDLIERYASKINSEIGEGAIVEFGSGDPRKIIPILRSRQKSTYVALDISKNQLNKSIKKIKNSFLNINALGVCCDHSKLKALPNHYLINNQRLIGFFPGSSLGNFESKEAINILINLKSLLKGGPLLVGIDHPKSKEKLEAAYNDRAGISSEFALNLLHRLNREMKATFKLDDFIYDAKWQEEKSRVKMCLISKYSQNIKIFNKIWSFTRGEELITEYSVKFTYKSFYNLVKCAGWSISNRWHDSNENFSILFLKPYN